MGKGSDLLAALDSPEMAELCANISANMNATAWTHDADGLAIRVDGARPVPADVQAEIERLRLEARDRAEEAGA